MPNATPNISLDVRNFPTYTPGWRNVLASNNQTYSYCYSGGDDNVGGLIQTVGEGRDTAPIRLTADQRYQIDSVDFVDDDQHQLTWEGSGNRAGTIIDANTMVETAEYTIVITDTDANCTIPCDPNIINR